LHLSKGKGTYESGAEVLHSDSIKSALFAAAIQNGANVHSDGSDNPFLTSFRVSSAFPFFQEEYFFPKPMGVSGHKICDESAKPLKKAGKALKFIGKSLFEDQIAGIDLSNKSIKKEEHLISEDDAEQVFSLASTSINQAIRKKGDFYVLRRTAMMRVTVPRVSSTDADPEPYYMEQTFFHPDAGLYFFIDWPKEEQYKQVLEFALDTLQDNGIGLDRNTGNGQFVWENAEMEINTPTNAKHQMLLSLYCPASKEEIEDKLDESAYNLIKRGGHVSASESEHLSYRKKSVYMMTEGSLLHGQPEDFKGLLLNLQPDIMKDKHPIWREGRPFLIPCHVPTKKDDNNKDAQ
jgi:CRISPR type III-A-associated RAMP protein Csm4